MVKRSIRRGVALGSAAMLLGSLTFSACGPLRRTYPDASWQGVSTGLKAPVTVYLDGLGVPHVFAQSDDDAAQAVGWLHGRDRRFQMELIRHAATGRLSELLGKSMLSTDRRLRLLSYQLDESVANLAPTDRARVEAYCRGINQAWDTTPHPLELKLLGKTPEPWTARDVIAVGRFQAWDLSADADREAMRDRLRGTVPQATFDWITSATSPLGNPIIHPEAVASERPALPSLPPPPAGRALTQAVVTPAESGIYELDPERTTPFSEGEKVALGHIVESMIDNGIGGSNGWAVAPSRTSHKQAMMAGDPHLDLTNPATFYEVHIHTPEVDVSGATFPGLPMVVIGRTATIGWTLTTSYADTQDLFALTVNPANPNQYLLDGKQQDFVQWEQTFKWGDKPEESSKEVFRVSRFGPVYNAGREDRIKAGATYALSWPGFSSDALPLIRSFDALYRADEPREVIDAIEMLPVPSQNWVFATTGGHIGYVLSGVLPARRASPLPRDGSVSSSAWTGFVSSADRPSIVDPPSGYIVASNQPVMADVGQFNTTANGHNRSLRIATALESRSDWDAASFRGLQVDRVNMEAARYLPLMLSAVGAADLSGDGESLARARAMREALTGWKYTMDATSNAPLIYEAWRGHLHRQLFSRHVKDAALLDTLLKGRITEAAMDKAMAATGADQWFDDPSTPAVETRAQVMRQALLDAEAELSGRLGTSVAGWTWGSVHHLTLEHPFATKKILKPLFGTESRPIDGGRHTILALDHEGVVGDYTATSGSALRQVVVPGTDAGFVIPGGNAGQSKHKNAMNQLDAWFAGDQHVAGGQEAELKAKAVGTIVLKP